MAILTISGRTALATAVANQPLHLAWGAGDPAWDVTPVDGSVNDTTLLSEIGRRGGPTIQYVVPDDNGPIKLRSGRYSVSLTPTRDLYLNFIFDYTDSPSSTIRELGVYIGTVINPLVLAATPGKLYFPPSDIQSPGTLLLLHRTAAIQRSSDVRQSFGFVLPF